MARGSHAVLGSLLGLIFLLTVVGAVLDRAVLHLGGRESMWNSFKHVVDLGSIEYDAGWGERLIGVGFVAIGIICSSVIIAIVISQFDASLERVRNSNARLPVVPDLVVLGWSDQIFTLVTEYLAGFDGRRTIAILSSHPRSWMDDEIARECPAAKARHRVSCRSGTRTDPRDLALVDIGRATRVVIFGEPEDRDDAEVIKTIFSLLTAAPTVAGRTVIAEVCSIDVADTVGATFGSEVTTVNSNEALSLVLAQAAREQGMGQLFDQLTSYRGGEFYQHPLPEELVGGTFGDAVWRCTNVSPIGLVRDHVARVLPPLDLELVAGDVLLVVDRRSTPPHVGAEPAPVEVTSWRPAEPQWNDQAIVVVGWNLIAARAVEHLRGFLGGGSSFTVLADRTLSSDAEVASLDAFPGVDVVWAESSRDQVQNVRQTVARGGCDAVVVVPYRDEMKPAQSDAATLLALASARTAIGSARVRVVGELRETRSAGLAALLRPDDLLLSDSVTASLIAQMIDRPWLDGVLADLLDFHGCALFLRDPARATALLDGAADPTYLDLRRAFLRDADLVIGLRVAGEIVLNPKPTAWLDLSAITGVVVVGGAVGWNTGSTTTSVSSLSHRLNDQAVQALHAPSAR